MMMVMVVMVMLCCRSRRCGRVRRGRRCDDGAADIEGGSLNLDALDHGERHRKLDRQ